MIASAHNLDEQPFTMARLFVVVAPSSINVDANLEVSQIAHEAMLDTTQ